MKILLFEEKKNISFLSPSYNAAAATEIQAEKR
jgi:hypothetical protein